MAKKNKKKKNKNNSFYKTIKPFIQDNRVIYSILGAAGVGVALASAFGTDKGRSLLDMATGALQNYGLLPKPESDTSLPDQEIANTKKPKTVRNSTL